MMWDIEPLEQPGLRRRFWRGFINASVVMLAIGWIVYWLFW
jgi:hypothetical protein